MSTGEFYEYDCDHTPEDSLRLLIEPGGDTAVRIETWVDRSLSIGVIRLTNEDARDLATRIFAALPDSDD